MTSVGSTRPASKSTPGSATSLRTCASRSGGWSRTERSRQRPSPRSRWASAHAAIFSVVNAVIFRPLPFAEPKRLVQMHGSSPLRSQGDGVSNLEEYRSQSKSFDALVGYEVSARYMRSIAGAERLMAVQVEPIFSDARHTSAPRAHVRSRR